ncbi:hypothetical protein HON52_02550 [Candidatus Uhrbacteria bacterium]|jgi:hypothetical protein|nr:hypothetical protein [Candidatus Uhrbacteria bacterium]
MHRPQGYTLIDVIAACLFVFVLVIVSGLLFSNPFTELERQHDEVRQDDVRSLMVAALELREESPEKFWALMDDLGERTMMIGTGESCGGPVVAGECSSVMPCMDVSELFAPYLDILPSDSNVAGYSESSSGYYMMYSESVFEIGACSPQWQSSINLMSYIE